MENLQEKSVTRSAVYRTAKIFSRSIARVEGLSLVPIMKNSPSCCANPAKGTVWQEQDKTNVLALYL